MKRENLVNLLYELTKNARRSDRELAKTLGLSQPSIGRLRKILEEEAILQYAAIPDLSYIGFDLMVFTLYRRKEPLQPIMKGTGEWLNGQPNVLFLSEGQGMDADGVAISIHKDYADFSEFHKEFRQEMNPYLETCKTFMVSLRGHKIARFFPFNESVKHALDNPSLFTPQTGRSRRSILAHILKTGPVLNVGDGETVIATYTSATDKMKIFSAYVREGLENGDAVAYNYPAEEERTVRAELERHGVDVKEYENDGSLSLESLPAHFMSTGKLDFKKAADESVEWWIDKEEKGYKHIRFIEDLGDLSFFDKQGVRAQYFNEYWFEPRWSDPAVSKWVEHNESGEVVYARFLKEITAINVENMSQEELHELIRAFHIERNASARAPTRNIDLLEYSNAFSRGFGLVHRELLGRKILMEVDPTLDFEMSVRDFADESIANVEPIYVFTSNMGTLRKSLDKYPAVKFILTRVSKLGVEEEAQKEAYIPMDNVDLILDSLDKVLQAYSTGNVSIVFDLLSDLFSSHNPERIFNLLYQALQLLSSKRATALFLFNANAHDPRIVSRLRNMFYNQLVCSKEGVKVVKLRKIDEQ